MNARNAKLIEDRYQSHPLLAGLRAVLETAESFAAKAAAVRTDKHLSVEGRSAKTEKIVRATLRDLRDMAAPVNEKRAELATIVAKIRPTSFDKADVAGALLRGEMRAALRNMTLAEKAALLTGEKADPTFVDAALEAHALLSGVDENMYEQVREYRLEALFATESFQAEKLGDEIAEADAIFQLAKQDVAAGSGLNEHQFAALQKEVESRKDAPWLRRETDINGREQIIVVPPTGGAARPATADEMRDGKYFASLVEYQAHRAA